MTQGDPPQYSDLEATIPDGLEPLTADSLGPSQLGTQSSSPEHAATEKDVNRPIKMRRTTLWLLVAISVLVLGALLGGLLGGLLPKAKSSSNTPTQTVTVSPGLSNPTSTPAPSSATGFASPSGCPVTDNTYYTVPGTDQKFLQQCNTGYARNDFTQTITTTFTDCIALCVAWNVGFNQTSMGNCSGVNWVDPQGQAGRYCYIKSKMENKATNQYVTSALLVTD